MTAAVSGCLEIAGLLNAWPLAIGAFLSGL